MMSDRFRDRTQQRLADSIPVGTLRTILDLLNREKIVGFFLIGVFSTALDILLIFVFTEYFGIWYLLSATLSYCCGMVVNFFLTKYLVFRDTSRDYFGQFIAFAIISISSLVLTLGILFLAVEMFSLHYLIGKLIAVVVAFFWNYYFQSTVTFEQCKEFCMRHSGARRKG